MKTNLKFLFSIIFCILFTSFTVKAATIVGENITTSGNTTVSGDIFSNSSAISLDQKIILGSLDETFYRTNSGYWGNSLGVWYDVDDDATTFDFGTSDFSVIWKGKLNQLDVYNPLVSKYHSWTNPGWRMTVQSNNKLEFCFNGPEVYCLHSDQLIETDKIYTFIATREGNENRLYINGVLEKTEEHIATDVNNNRGLRISTDYSSGKSAYADHYNVSIFDTFISDLQAGKLTINPYNPPVELSDNEVLALGPGKTENIWYDKKGRYRVETKSDVSLLNKKPISANDGLFSDQVIIGSDIFYYSDIFSSSAPESKLIIKGSTSDNTASALNVVDSGFNSKFLVRNDGNVGIGTTSPESKLHLNGGVGTLSTGLTFGDGDSGFYEASDDNLRIQTAGTDRLLIKEDGSVGIGTTNPATALDVEGEVKFGNSSTACTATNEGSIRYDSDNKIFQGCNGTDWLQISFNTPE